MKSWLAAVFLLLSVTRHVQAGCSVALSAQLPVIHVKNRAMVDVAVNGQPATLMLDTGSFSNILSTVAARRLRLHADLDGANHFRGVPRDPYTIEGLGGTGLGDEVVADTFQVGAMHGRHFHFVTADLGSEKLDGFLSTDSLSGYDIDLDVPGSEVRLYRWGGACERPRAYLQEPLYTTPLAMDADDKRPQVSVLIDGHKFRALIDTGASTSTIYRSAAETLGVVFAQTDPARRFTVTGFGPHSVSAVRHAFSLTIGDLTFRNMPVAIVDKSSPRIDLLLGADFQRKVHLWISNSSRTLVMQYPPQASPLVQGQ